MSNERDDDIKYLEDVLKEAKENSNSCNPDLFNDVFRGGISIGRGRNEKTLTNTELDEYLLKFVREIGNFKNNCKCSKE